MPYVKVETTVPRNRKFLQAGPAPSWLWLAGLCYCQDNLTDGFVPGEVLVTLVAKNAKQLVSHLEKAGLWRRVDGGWHIHDYLEHNRSAAQVAVLRANGKRGGRPQKNHIGFETNTKEATSLVSHGKTKQKTSVVSDAKTFAVSVSVADAVVGAGRGGQGETNPPMDEWFEDLKRAYPPQAVSSGHRTMTAFVDAVLSKGTPNVTFTVMLVNLENQKRGHQWRVKGMIPRLETWLRDGLWEQQHDEQPPAESAATHVLHVLGGRS